MKLSYTIYRKVNEPHPETGELDHAAMHGRVGISLSPMPSTTVDGLNWLIGHFNGIIRAMTKDEGPNYESFEYSEKGE